MSPRWSGLLPGADLYAAAVVQRHGDRSVASAVSLSAAIDWMVAIDRDGARAPLAPARTVSLRRPYDGPPDAC
jgi:hypothetical protein